MNIFEISAKSGIPLKSLRKLERMNINFGKLDSEPDIFFHAAKIRFTLMRKGQLTVEQLFQLLDDPAIYDELKKYQGAARTQVAALGDVKATPAPREVTAAIDAAAGGDVDAAHALAGWLMGILPASPVGHHWVACRILFPLNAFMREQMAPRISLALMHMRKVEEFAPYWASIKAANGRNSIFYSQPKTLDL